MQIGDLVRTKQSCPPDYDRRACIIIGAKSRLDGTYFAVIDHEGKVRNWWPDELELINESR